MRIKLEGQELINLGMSEKAFEVYSNSSFDVYERLNWDCDGNSRYEITINGEVTNVYEPSIDSVFYETVGNWLNDYFDIYM